MQLYKIAKEFEEIMLLLESEEETDDKTLVEYMDKLEQDYTEKLDNIACYIKNEQAISDAIDNEVRNLLERKKSHDKRVLRLKEYVSSFMEQMGLNKLETARNKISFRKSEITLTDEELIKKLYPHLVQRVVVENIPSKPELKKMYKAGQVEMGVEIIEKQNIQIK